MAATDLCRWRLTCEKGRQTWHYLGNGSEEEDSEGQTFAEKYFLGLTEESKVSLWCELKGHSEVIKCD